MHPALRLLAPCVLAFVAACGASVGPSVGPDASTSDTVPVRPTCAVPWGGTCYVGETCTFGDCSRGSPSVESCTCSSARDPVVCTSLTCELEVDAGMPTCSPPGGSCSSDVDCCGAPCVMHVCTAPPADDTFACGPTARCRVNQQYCQRTLSDTGGPDEYDCMPVPSECPPTPDCACLMLVGCGGCTMDSPGALTMSCGGG